MGNSDSTSIEDKAELTMVWKKRDLSLPKSVKAMGGYEPWNKQANVAQLQKTMAGACTANTVEAALAEVRGLMSLEGHNLYAYAYLRKLFDRDPDVYYGALLTEPELLLPVAYTPTVGEACQKFGYMPLYERGCYVCLEDRFNVKSVLQEYAEAMLPKKEDGSFDCECIVFSDGGRILGLGDLGAFGMGIPIGKLDLYTVCGGFNPHKTIPVIIDAGCLDANGNSAKLPIRESNMYTGMKKNRMKHKSAVGTDVNTVYYGEDSFIGEFMTAASDLFGKGCLLQFEDFNSNDAFPLLATYRDKFLTYNDDIQGTASVAVAALLGGIKIQNPGCTELIKELSSMRVLFHGAGSANLGASSLLVNEAGVPANQVFCTNSRGLIWRSEDGSEGTFRNDEQKAAAQVGKPDFDSRDLISIIRNTKPDILIGAVGVAPGCFTKEVIEAMVKIQDEKPNGGMRPIVFALSNPQTQAEITSKDCYEFSQGKAIYGSGTRMASVEVDGTLREPGQVNNFFIFPGMSFGAMVCQARTIPEKWFMIAAEAVANTLDSHDIKVDSVVPHPSRIREVGQNVATAVVLEAQASGFAGKTIGSSKEEVRSFLDKAMWLPKNYAPKSKAQARPRMLERTKSDMGGMIHVLSNQELSNAS